VQRLSLALWIFVGLLLTGMAVIGGVPQPQSDADYDHGIIAYSKTAPDDPVARLQRQLDAGEISLEYDPRRGYLPAILRALNVSTTSQTLVFSKTSFQFTQIAPKRPRALYFNDDVYVGSVQGSPLLEFAAVDPKLGAVFYELEEEENKPPKFRREIYACLLCHDSSGITGGVPGFMTLSVLPDPKGNAIRTASTAAMSDQTSFNERFGGWYVTGTHGKQLHRGNVVVPVGTLMERIDWSKGANIATLEDTIDTKEYLTPHSDIVALIALTHQTRIHNLITRVTYETRQALQDEETVKREAPSRDSLSSITVERIHNAVEPLVRGMFFVREAALKESVRGASGFASDFEKRGIRDRKGRSLRDLDLNRRFLRYPMSYLIYSEAFDAIPAPAKEYFYQRVRAVLTGTDTTGNFAHLSAEDRTAILEILRDTKPEFEQTAVPVPASSTSG
jgi:hypothetical protein